MLCAPNLKISGPLGPQYSTVGLTKKSEQDLMLCLCVLDAFASSFTKLGATMGELN